MPHTVNRPSPTATRKFTRRAFLKRAALWSGGVLLPGSYGWARQVEPHRLEVRRVDLLLPRLAPAFDGVTLAQISDIHAGGWMNRERLQKVVAATNALQADYIVITGDFASRAAAPYLSVLNTLSALAPRHDTLCVLGNHDHWSNAREVRRALGKTGISELRNTHHTLRRGQEVLHIAGIDDAWVGAGDVRAVLDRLPQKGAVILLAHEPDFADSYAAFGRFDAQLSGHSHGGQIQFPLIGPIVLPRYGQKYHTGRYRVGTGGKTMTLYVNRGVGMVKPYVRFNCRPEITLFTLRAPVV
ncbi:MAG TPA: metallophosphoesterase [Abditibacteriaceae bacterium]|nr:metallophosphoesterase [Abditibacteriaceae bacterium]